MSFRTHCKHGFRLDGYCTKCADEDYKARQTKNEMENEMEYKINEIVSKKNKIIERNIKDRICSILWADVENFNKKKLEAAAPFNAIAMEIVIQHFQITIKQIQDMDLKDLL